MRYKVDFIRVRYNRLAPIYPLFDLLFWLPRNISVNAVKRLDLKSGDKVLEVGCGTGRNLSRLVDAVGPHRRGIWRGLLRRHVGEG
jgi:ubiquinone/menaquinone biosynthesis C-methylase UbiE